MVPNDVYLYYYHSKLFPIHFRISSTKCPQHPDEIVDLQAIFFGKSSGEKRYIGN